MNKKIICFLILMTFILFKIQRVNAYTDSDCPDGYTLDNSNVCIKTIKAKWRNGVYYCDPGTGDLKNKECITYYYLPEEDDNNTNSNTDNQQNDNSANSNTDNQQNANANVNVSKNNYDSLCSTSNTGVRQVVKIIGYFIRVILWIVPFLIILFGMIDFVKAMVSKDDNAISVATNSLIRRLIIGIAVFFIPTIIIAILRVVEVTNGIENEENSQFGACTKCIFDPFNCKTE